MKWARKRVVLITLIALSSAASAQDLTKLAPEELIRISSIQVFKGPIERPSADLSSVSGVSCTRLGLIPQYASEEDATRKMKYSAVKLGADAIKNAICIERAQFDFKHMCHDTVVCAGVAVKYKLQN